METRWRAIFIHQMQAISEKERKEIIQCLKELQKSGLGAYEDGQWIETHRGKDIYRIKAKGSHADHRIFLDNNGNNIDIYGMMHRDRGYGQGYSGRQDPESYIQNLLSGIDWNT